VNNAPAASFLLGGTYPSADGAEAAKRRPAAAAATAAPAAPPCDERTRARIIFQHEK